MLRGRLWLRSRRDGAAWVRSCKPAARGRRRLHGRDRPRQTDKSIGSVDRGRHGGVNLSWPSDRGACSFGPPASRLENQTLPMCRVQASRGFPPHARRSFFERVHGLSILLVGLSTTLADFSRARDSQITFSVTHGWSAFWRGRPWLAGRRIGETSLDV